MEFNNNSHSCSQNTATPGAAGAVVFMFCTWCFHKSSSRRSWKVLWHPYSEERSLAQALRFQALIQNFSSKVLSQKHPWCVLPTSHPNNLHAREFVWWQLCLVKGILTEDKALLSSVNLSQSHLSLALVPTTIQQGKWKSLSCVWLLATPWTVVHGILQTRIPEWVAFPFSRGSYQPRDRTQVSRIAGRFFTSWAIQGSHKVRRLDRKP